MARGWRNIAREAARTVSFWLPFSLITYLGMIAAIRIEATRTRLFLVVVVFSVAYGAASLLERLLWDFVLTDIQPDGEPTENWPQWLLTSLAPIVLRDRISYSYAVLPQPQKQGAAHRGQLRHAAGATLAAQFLTRD